MVGSILTYNLGAIYAVITTSTVLAYTYFTIKISDWRTGQNCLTNSLLTTLFDRTFLLYILGIRKRMNALESSASGTVVDSLINYETVKLFSNESHEIDKYDVSLKGFQRASIATQQSLSLLNFGQSAIFSVGKIVCRPFPLPRVWPA